MKKHFYLIAALGLGIVSCTDSDLKNDGVIEGDNSANATNSHLTKVKLATFNGDQNRVSYFNGTRAEEEETTTPLTLELIASIENPSKTEGFNFTKEEGGRWLSATSLYYHSATKNYYVTYHMQGNNYNTKLDNEIGGTIQSFQISDNGEVILGKGFRSEDPNVEDFDFNHLYFENTTPRIITVGHKWNVPSSWTEEGPYTGKRENTRAIIGVFDPVDGELTYSTIDTSEKAYDENGKSLGYKDAGDANCVIRAGETMNKNHTSGWNFYYVATRKGMAVLSAEDESLFAPVLDEDGTNYFIPTPGSAKFVARTGTSSFFDLLYLAEDKPNDSYSQKSEAKIAHFSTQTGEGTNFGFLKERGTNEVFKPKEKNILNHGDQTDVPAVISPIDGKNTLLCAPDTYNDRESYAALGTSGMYYYFNGVNSNNVFEGVLEFKGLSNKLPVNCVTADVSDQESGHDGFIYVACGARLVILHRKTFELVAFWNMPAVDEEGNDIEASANYIHVEKGPVNDDRQPRERIITVAFGQAGVKVFRFKPATLESKTVWEKELPSFIQCR